MIFKCCFVDATVVDGGLEVEFRAAGNMELTFSSQMRSDSGCPCSSCWTCKTCVQSSGLPFIHLLHSVYRASMETKVGISGREESV